MSKNDLHLKYRPNEWGAVYGQDHIVDSIMAVLKKKAAHSFLLSGPSGVGKTTLARIIAAEVKADPHNVLEIDAATHTGIDAMREITSILELSAWGVSPVRVVIVDECHALSKAAWQSMLKSIEEPPPDVYWCLCTTELAKVPKNIQTRCAAFKLQYVPTDDIEDILNHVCIEEDLMIDEKIIRLIAKKSEGSPRRALVDLAKIDPEMDFAQVKEICESLGEEADIIELCRELAKGTTWEKVASILKKSDNIPPENIRIMVLSYFTNIALKKADPRAVVNILEAFADPFEPREGKAPLALALIRVLYGE